MIEVLIKYIQDKGFEVHVIPGCISIWKKDQDLIFEVIWMIPKRDIRPEFEDMLLYEANRKLWELDEAIAAKKEH